MIITLGLPPRELSPNARPHWAAKARAVKRYRTSAHLVTLVVIGRQPAPRWTSATAMAKFYWPDDRRRDRDNALASLKPAYDGIADAGLIANDSGLIHLPVEFAADRANPRVEIEIQEKPGGQLSALASLSTATPYSR